MWCHQLFSFKKGYPLKYRVNKENSNRNVRFGNTVLSQQGDAAMAGNKAPGKRYKQGFLPGQRNVIVVLVDGHDLDDVPVLEHVVFLYPHLCPCINGI